MGNGPQRFVNASGAAALGSAKPANPAVDNPKPKNPKAEKKLHKSAGSKISQAGTRLTELRCLETQLRGMMPTESGSQNKVANGLLPV